MESKNNHVVHKHAFYWRYDTGEELALLNELWQLVSLRLNFFIPTKRPIDYATTTDGRRKRIYDEPATPLAARPGIRAPERRADCHHSGTRGRHQSSRPDPPGQPHPATTDRSGPRQDPSAGGQQRPRPGTLGIVDTSTPDNEITASLTRSKNVRHQHTPRAHIPVRHLGSRLDSFKGFGCARSLPQVVTSA